MLSHIDVIKNTGIFSRALIVYPKLLFTFDMRSIFDKLFAYIF